MAKYKVEVRDVGGTGVGTSVFLTDKRERAISWLAATVKEPWAGPWRIKDACYLAGDCVGCSGVQVRCDRCEGTGSLD